MRMEPQANTRRQPFHIPWTLGYCLFLAIALFLLWSEHKAHILGALPYVLLLLCPFIHLFMHRGHGGHGGDGSGGEDHAQHRRGQGGIP